MLPSKIGINSYNKGVNNQTYDIGIAKKKKKKKIVLGTFGSTLIIV